MRTTNMRDALAFKHDIYKIEFQTKRRAKECEHKLQQLVTVRLGTALIVYVSHPSHIKAVNRASMPMNKPHTWWGQRRDMTNFDKRMMFKEMITQYHKAA
jgi:hypothetical protein